MRAKKLVVDAMKSIYKNKSRSILTALGIIIGVSAVIVMVGVGKGTSKEIQTSIESLGTNMLIIFPSFSQRGGVSQGAGSRNRLTFEDVEAIRENATHLQAVSSIVSSSAQVIAEGKNWSTRIEGVDAQYLTIRSWDLESGEFFDERAVRTRKKEAVIGKTVKDELFGEDSDPIGQRIRIRNIPFTIIGVLAEKGQDARGSDQDDIIIAPSTTVLYRLKGGRYVNLIQASAKTVEEIDSAKSEITAILRKLHRIDDYAEDDFNIRTQTEITEMASSTSETLTLLLGAIACVSLIVGGIGIMNIMLVSVTERTREIGIRMALGARESDILVQFLSEAIILSISGGVLGILIAVSLIFVINNFTSLPAIVDPVIVILSVVFAGSVGVFFGYYPAKKASKLNPIDALRYE